jgi:Uncharacterised protein conserved in bacteria (DUF2336)
MTTSPLFPGFDGLLTLSRREGVDIRPTLLRVLTDLYVQASKHTIDEERQFIELTSRLIDEVDDATRAAVRARLAVYPGTPAETLRKLGLRPARPDQPVPLARAIASPPPPEPSTAPPLADAQLRLAQNLSMQPADAAEISGMFFGANAGDRVSILHSLADTPLKASPRIPLGRALRSIDALEMAAFTADVENFTLEIGETLILPARIAAQVVDDPGGEPLVCAAKALGMPAYVFQRVLLFLKPEIGTSVVTVYRLSRMYDDLSERSALVMLAAWRGSILAVARAKYRPSLYDDERSRARPSAQPRTAPQPDSGTIVRIGTQATRR